MKAYAKYDPQVGYCQGMAFLAGFLLMHMPEQEAFWTLVQMMYEYGLRYTFVTGMPLLREYMHILHCAVVELLPKLSAHLAKVGVAETLFAPQWIATLFSSHFPAPWTARVWDLWFVLGPLWVVKVSFALLQINQQGIMSQRTFEGVVQALRNINNPKENVEEVINIALACKLTPTRLKQWQDDFRKSDRRTSDES